MYVFSGKDVRNVTFVRNFLIALLVSLLVFTPLAYFGVNYVVGEVETGLANKKTGDDSEDDDGQLDMSELSGELSLSLAMICRSDNPDYIDPNAPLTEPFPDVDPPDTEQIDDTPENPFLSDEELLPRADVANPQKTVDFITLVSVNPDKKRTVAITIPGCLVVEFKGTSMSLSDALYFASLPEYNVDERYIADLITGCTGVSVDCYDYVDTVDFVRAADSLGRIAVNFPEATTIYDGATRFFPKGENNLSSSDLLSLIRYDNYTNPSLKYQIVSAACIAILDKGCTTTAFSSFDQMWARISPYMEYDLGKYLTPRAVAEKLLVYQNCASVAVNAIGQFGTDTDGRKSFEIDRTNTIAQISRYGG